MMFIDVCFRTTKAIIGLLHPLANHKVIAMRKAASLLTAPLIAMTMLFASACSTTSLSSAGIAANATTESTNVVIYRPREASDTSGLTYTLYIDGNYVLPTAIASAHIRSLDIDVSFPAPGRSSCVGRDGGNQPRVMASAQQSPARSARACRERTGCCSSASASPGS